MDRPIPMSGVMSGATSIAPMITAPELPTRPNVAMPVASPIRAMKSKFHWEFE